MHVSRTVTFEITVSAKVLMEDQTFVFQLTGSAVEVVATDAVKLHT